MVVGAPGCPRQLPDRLYADKAYDSDPWCKDPLQLAGRLDLASLLNDFRDRRGETFVIRGTAIATLIANQD